MAMSYFFFSFFHPNFIVIHNNFPLNSKTHKTDGIFILKMNPNGPHKCVPAKKTTHTILSANKLPKTIIMIPLSNFG